MYEGEPLSSSAKQVGQIKITDNGLSVNCGLLETLNLGKTRTQQAGGNLLYITKIKLPDSFSTCFRLEATIYNSKSDSLGQESTYEQQVLSNKENSLFPEIIPEFPGGDVSLKRFVEKHFSYPETALQDRVGGIVILQFVVDKTGKIKEVEVVKSVRSDLDNEAKRIIALLPEFKPAFQNYKPVSFRYTLPITFHSPAPLFKKKETKS